VPDEQQHCSAINSDATDCPAFLLKNPRNNPDLPENTGCGGQAQKLQ
jgi:hypothetical protein